MLLIAAFPKPPKPEEEPQISDASKQTDTTVEIASTERIDKEELWKFSAWVLFSSKSFEFTNEKGNDNADSRKINLKDPVQLNHYLKGNIVSNVI